MEAPKHFWTCLKCNEEVDDQFEVCWNCQHDRSGNLPPGFSSLEEEDRAEKQLLNEKWSDRRCVGCQSVLRYVGQKEFQTGPGLGVIGDFVQLSVGQTKLEMYYCPACGRVEFFV